MYELKQDKDRDVRDNTDLTNVSEEVLKLSVMFDKMNSLETPNDVEPSGSGATTAKEEFELENNLHLDTTTTSSNGSDTIIESVLTDVDETPEVAESGVEKAEEVQEGSPSEIPTQTENNFYSEEPPKEENEPQTVTTQEN